MKPPPDKDSVIARYIEGPVLLEKALAGLKEADLDIAPSKGGWTIRQISSDPTPTLPPLTSIPTR